jgi:hypothetical protein
VLTVLTVLMMVAVGAVGAVAVAVVVVVVMTVLILLLMMVPMRLPFPCQETLTSRCCLVCDFYVTPTLAVKCSRTMYSARFSTEICTRGCHGVSHLCSSA